MIAWLTGSRPFVRTVTWSTGAKGVTTTGETVWARGSVRPIPGESRARTASATCALTWKPPDRQPRLHPLVTPFNGRETRAKANLPRSGLVGRSGIFAMAPAVGLDLRTSYRA